MRSYVFLFLILFLIFGLISCCNRYKPKSSIASSKVSHKVNKVSKQNISKKKNKKDSFEEKNVPALVFNTSQGTYKFDDYSVKEVVEDLNNRKFVEAAKKIAQLKKSYPSGSPQREILDYLYVDTLFSNNNLYAAKYQYEEFLQKYPNSPLKENVKKALEFIKNIKKYKKMYVPPEKDVR